MRTSKQLRGLLTSVLSLSVLLPGLGCTIEIFQQQQGEQCDDGNVVNGDGCESNCTLTP